jgi:hypothetical protein
MTRFKLKSHEACSPLAVLAQTQLHVQTNTRPTTTSARAQPAWRKETKRTLERSSKGEPEYQGPAGMVASSHANPLGRASMSKPVSSVLDTQSAAVVPIKRDSGTGAVAVSNDPRAAMNLARRSAVLSSDPARRSQETARMNKAANTLVRNSKTAMAAASASAAAAPGGGPNAA